MTTTFFFSWTNAVINKIKKKMQRKPAVREGLNLLIIEVNVFLLAYSAHLHII